MLVKLCHFKRIVPLTDIIQDIETLKKKLKGPEEADAFEAQPSPPVEPITERKTPKREEPEISHVSKEISSEKGTHVALQDPTVKYFIETFKAQVLSIEPINKGKK